MRERLPRRVLVVHNRHRASVISGENRVVDTDVSLLRDEGVEIETYSRSNDEIDDLSLLGRADMAIRPIVSVGDARALRAQIRRFKPDVVHVHNLIPLLSPWIVRAVRAEGIPVVQTVHNYLHVCIAANYFRDGRPCHDCASRAFPWPAVVHGCSPTTRPAGPVGIRLAGTVLGASLAVHRPTWRLVDRFLPVGRAVARHLEHAGIDPSRISVRRNPVSDPGPATPVGNGGAFFAGRFAAEKGVFLLLEAWKRSGLGTRYRLRLAGDGPSRVEVERLARAIPGVEVIGRVDHARVLELISGSSFVVAPSLWEEPFGLTVVEGLACGRPVLVTNRGEPAEMIDPETGWVVEPTIDALAGGFRAAFGSPLEELGRAARRTYESRHSPGVSIRGLLAIYSEVMSPN